MHRTVLTSAVGCLTLALIISADSTASAGLTLGVDVNVSVPASVRAHEIGTGFGGRAGYSLDLGPLALTPELGVAYARMAEHGAPMRVFSGGRLSLTGLIEPCVYGHYGYAWVNSAPAGMTYDLGGALDLNVAIARVGIHASYVSIARPMFLLRYDNSYAGDALAGWIELGMHGGVEF